MSDWQRWFAWRPQTVRCIDTSRPSADNIYYVGVWLSSIERRYQGGEWEYRLVQEDKEELHNRVEAARYAYRHPSRVLLMARMEDESTN